TGTLGVGAEQGGLDAVGLRERVANRIEHTSVRRRVAPPRATDRSLVGGHPSSARWCPGAGPGMGFGPTDTTPSRPDTEPWISELLPDPATPVTTTSTPSGMSTSTSRRLLVLAPRTSSTP